MPFGSWAVRSSTVRAGRADVPKELLDDNVFMNLSINLTHRRPEPASPQKSFKQNSAERRKARRLRQKAESGKRCPRCGFFSAKGDKHWAGCPSVKKR